MRCRVLSSMGVFSLLFALISLGCEVSSDTADGAGAEGLARSASPDAGEARTCRDCACGDGDEAPIGTPCGKDGQGACRSGTCLYWCGSVDGDCGVTSRFLREAVNCGDPCGKYGVCPTPEAPAACHAAEM